MFVTRYGRLPIDFNVGKWDWGDPDSEEQATANTVLSKFLNKSKLQHLESHHFLPQAVSFAAPNSPLAWTFRSEVLVKHPDTAHSKVKVSSFQTLISLDLQSLTHRDSCWKITTNPDCQQPLCSSKSRLWFPYHPQKHREVLYLPYVLSGDPPRILMFYVDPCSELGFRSLGLAGMFNGKW